ncbi:sensor histidine kinase [Ramlibacter sp. PS3R-8]|uniref:sensor histidine kinase n=1 Tax=Ramlibacter sp. PS3R-8 TaxID=3133437 RepID=UPI0030A0B16C
MLTVNTARICILTAAITRHNLVIIRDRARAVGTLCGLDKMDGTRFVTAVSEVARNAVQYAGEGTVSFHIDLGDFPGAAQYVVAEVADRGPGISDLSSALDGRVNAAGIVGRGLASCKRLADRFEVRQPPAGGTVVVIEMARAGGQARLQPAGVAALAAQLAGRKPQSVQEEYEQQQRDMVQALQALRDRQSELEMADERKNQFVATLAHELRNPLGTLQMSLHILNLKPELQQPELVKHLAVIARQAKQLNQLVNDLMDASRVSQGKVVLDKRPTDMNELVSQALEMTGAAMAARNTRWTSRCSGSRCGWTRTPRA